MPVFTMGSFDTLHPGHIGLLKLCHRFAGHGSVVVGLNSDSFMEAYKGKPIFNYEERRQMLGGCRHVDWIVENDGTQQPALIASYAANGLLVVGDDWEDRDYFAQVGFDSQTEFQGFLVDHNIVLRYVPRTGAWSTTQIRTRLT